MVRLKDIAEKVGVSVMTVSRVLRNSPDISEQTREKVLKAAWEMGYVPDATARGLRTGTSLLVGIALPTLSQGWVGLVLDPIEKFVSETQRDLLIASAKGTSEEQENAVDRLLSRRVEGIWLMPLKTVERPVNLYQRINRQNVKLVYVGVDDPNFDAPKAIFDYDQQIELAVSHLVELGHKSIAFVSGCPLCLAAERREKAFIKAINKLLGGQNPIIIAGGIKEEEIDQAVQILLSGYPDVTAIVADNDILAVQLIKKLNQKGIDVPHDLSVIGWGNDQSALASPVPLTTISVPWTAIAQKAAEMMNQLLPRRVRGQPYQEIPRPEDVILPGELIVRASTASPKK